MVKLRLEIDHSNPKNDKWIVLPKGSKEVGSIYMDGILHSSFKNAKEVMSKKNLDLVIVVTGYPGSGKSKLVGQMAAFCDPSFTEDRMYQSSQEFIDGIEQETEVLKSHVLDEAWEGLSSTQVRKEVGKLFMNLLNTIRQKRLFIFLVLPDFFDLSKNIAIFRSRWLIHCYSESFGEVGRFVMFDRATKKQLYLRGKQYENYSAVKADFRGVFRTADSPRFNWENYENVIKPRAMELSFRKDDAEKESVAQRNKLLVILKIKHKYKLLDLSEMMEMNYNYMCELVKATRRNMDPEFLKSLEPKDEVPEE